MARAEKRPRARSSGASMASPTSSSHNANGAAATARIPTYILMKEERDGLAEQVAVLEDELEELRKRVGLPSREDKAAITQIEERSFELQERIVGNTVQIGRMHSLVTHKLLSPPLKPLSTFIHLPREMDARRAMLRSLKHPQLQRAERFCYERLYHLDPCMEYLKEERYTCRDGLFHCDRYEINQFPNFQTAQQLYDVLLYFLSTMEISITDMIGQLTLREDSDDIEPTIWNHRIVTTTEDVGCIEELNLVGFAHFYKTHGVFTYITVDDDDLYPYKPLERTRKDSHVGHVVCEVVDPETQQKIVVLKTCTQTTELKPGFDLPPSIEEKLHKHASRWARLIVEYLHEYKVVEAPPPPAEAF